MPYYNNNYDMNILFIHIPKTGGSNIEQNLKKKCEQTLFSQWKNDILPSPYDKIALQHQTYMTLYNYKDKLNINFENIKIFSVVRNPYDRVISDLFWFKLINLYDSSTRVYNIIKNNYLYRDCLDNHNIPQYKFVTNEKGELIENIKIFKTEKLNECNEEINKYLNVNINLKSENVNKDYSEYLNKHSIKLINEFYSKDFELFGYEKK
jgi:hypothetical protein